MPQRLNLGPNARLWPAGGFPLRLWPGGDSVAIGAIPARYGTVTAEVRAERKADVHLALYRGPLLPDGADSLLVAQADLSGLTQLSQTLTVTAPALDDEAEEQTGTVTLTADSTAVTGSGTAFPLGTSWEGLELQVGSGPWQAIESVTSATALVLATEAPASAAGAFRVRLPPVRLYSVRLWVDQVEAEPMAAVTRRASSSVSTSGTVSTTIGDNIVTGSSTAFDWSWTGYTLVVGSASYTVAEVYSTTRLRTVEHASATASGSAYSVTHPAATETQSLTSVYVDSLVVS